MGDLDSKNNLLEALKSFEKATLQAVGISESRLGVYHTGRQNRVLTAYAKAIAHAMSIQALYSNSVVRRSEIGFLDHFSIGALSRTLIDAAIMTLYLSEPSLSEAEWDLRRHVLFLHDATNRKRFLNAMHKHIGEAPSTGDLNAYRQSKESILLVIARRGKELGLDDEKIEELSKGQLVFVDGVRGAVREAEIDVSYFEFIHVYLSNHVHSHPVSLLRYESFSFEAATEFQLGFCALCLEVATAFLERTNERVGAFTGDMARDPNGHVE